MHEHIHKSSCSHASKSAPKTRNPASQVKLQGNVILAQLLSPGKGPIKLMHQFQMCNQANTDY